MVSPRHMLDLFTKAEELLEALRQGKTIAEELVAENERMNAQISERSETLLERRLADLEQQNNTLASLYVASCQLHRSPEPAAIARSIAEVVAGLIGASEYGIFVLDEETGDLVLVEGENVEDQFPDGRIRPGEGVEGMALESGVAYFGSPGAEDHDKAFVPLRSNGRVVGAVGVYRLLSQKHGGFSPLDYELFNLIAAQGGTAFLAAKLISRTNDLSA